MNLQAVPSYIHQVLLLLSLLLLLLLLLLLSLLLLFHDACTTLTPSATHNTSTITLSSSSTY